ncbi:umecyanin-like [Quercus lobata]|uniref:Phytocyanin domain-containing protein n=1 Tax=Quercus lobata TaxID=97700 RepID=A0A7N2L1V1_QUELO|nr:umecyanin-like [Quercus lobata]
MANPISMTIVVVVVLTALAAVVQVSEAVNYVVGDTTGWAVPSSSTFYTTWVNGKNFSLGDVLEFNFMTGQHDVATVSKTDYDACSIANAITNVTTGPYNYTINSNGPHYFICTFSNGGHCRSGQKLTISIGSSTEAASPGSPPTTPSSSPPPPPPPAGSSASPLAATLPLVFMTIALAFFY